jgi:hypothetical protein
LVASYSDFANKFNEINGTLTTPDVPLETETTPETE